MAYSKLNNLCKRSQSENMLTDKTFKIACKPKHVGYQRRLAKRYLRFLTKNLQEMVLKIKLKQIKKLQMNFMNQVKQE